MEQEIATGDLVEVTERGRVVSIRQMPGEGITYVIQFPDGGYGIYAAENVRKVGNEQEEG